MAAHILLHLQQGTHRRVLRNHTLPLLELHTSTLMSSALLWPLELRMPCSFVVQQPWSMMG